MHVLVTGGGGFLGRYIVEQFVARGEQVRTFSRRAYRELEELGVEQIRGDLKNSVQVRKACASVDCVVHAAAQPGIAMRPNGYYAANLEGTQHVIDACLAEQVERLVYTSSPSVTFAGRDQCGVDESEPLALEWLQTHRAYYSHSKALAERLVLTVDQNRLRTCALRPHLIWGPRDGHLIPRLIQRARQGRLRRVGAGTNRVDVIYVENAAAAHLAACDALGGAAAAAG
ncbi:MAG: NAD-dependent epimerase/dehydratase family protein, partial [Planctomycetales bacterium]|nr:NAD-dependent epimerase/dehydratase family protein [Planctomycetales bacterium]